MALNFRSPEGNNPPASSHKITRSFALIVLLAVIVLWALRHVFGSVRLEAGTR
jgi:hypothetical protein